MPPPTARPRQPTAELLKTFNAQNSANYGEDEVAVAELLSWIKITIIPCLKRTTAIRLQRHVTGILGINNDFIKII